MNITSSPDKQSIFAQLVRDQQAHLRAFIQMLGVQPDSVDDLAQETFLVAFRELDSFDKERDFGKWLRGIARNLVRNEIRKTARRCRIIDEELTQHLLAQAEEGHSDEGFDDEDFRALRDCLESLPEKSRKLIAGRYADEWKAPFLADQMEMSANAVRLALMRIRQRLRGCIETRLSNA